MICLRLQMWTAGVNYRGSSSSSNSKSSSSTSSSPSSFSPPAPNNPRAKTMEEVWKDINLSSLHDHSTSRDDPQGNSYTTLQDFLGRPFASIEPSSTSAVSAGYGSPAPPPATMLTLNSVPDFHFLGNSDPFRQHPLLQCQQPTPPHLISSYSNVPFYGLENSSSSGLSNNGKKRFPDPDNNSGDRRNKRMIKNRESAARSRARKQAYTNELEQAVAHLTEENARLKRQQQQLYQAAAIQLPKKHSLQRTSTAPF